MKTIKDTWPKKIKDEIRSLELNIAMDHVNTYSLQNTNYFVWPIVVINTNTLRWSSMNNEHLMLALIVPLRRQVKNMDVLQPWVDELKEF